MGLIRTAAFATVTSVALDCALIAFSPRGSFVTGRASTIDWRWLGLAPSDWNYRMDLLISWPEDYPPFSRSGPGVVELVIRPGSGVVDPPPTEVRRIAAGFPSFSLQVTSIASPTPGGRPELLWTPRWRGLALNSLTASLVAVLGITLTRSARRRARRARSLCIRCAHPRNSALGVCPECGDSPSGGSA